MCPFSPLGDAYGLRAPDFLQAPAFVRMEDAQEGWEADAFRRIQLMQVCVCMLRCSGDLASICCSEARRSACTVEGPQTLGTQLIVLVRTRTCTTYLPGTLSILAACQALASWRRVQITDRRLWRVPLAVLSCTWYLYTALIRSAAGFLSCDRW